MITIRKVITIVILSCILGCSPSNSTQNNSSNNSSPQSQSDILKDTSIVPGKRFGRVTGKTTRSDLVKMFGESKLKDDIILEDEGTISVPVTKVNLGAEHSFTIAWEEDTRERLLYKRFRFCLEDSRRHWCRNFFSGITPKIR